MQYSARLTSAKEATLTLLTASAPAVSTARYGGPPAKQNKEVTHYTSTEERKRSYSVMQ